VSSPRVTVIGDSTLDVTVRTGEALRAGGDAHATISLVPGGQGANVAVRLARAGVPVRLATALADDMAGRMLLAALEADRVALATAAPAEHSGVVMVLVDQAGERSMLSDRVNLELRAVRAACVGVEWVHCSGYPLADDDGGDELAAHLGTLGPTRVSVGGGSLQFDAKRAAKVRDRLSAARPRLLVFGLDEAAALLDTPHPSLPAAADAIASAFPGAVAVVTGGAAGSAAAGPGFALSVAAHDPSTPMVDATGAGDAYAACLIAGLLDGDWPPGVPALRTAMESATHLGALVSRVVGAQGRVGGERASQG